MNSVYGKLVLWSVATMVVGLLAVTAVSVYLTYHETGSTEPTRWDSLMLDDTIAAYRNGGRQGLAEQIARYDRHLRGKWYLTDASGRDLLTGELRLSGEPPSGWIVNAYASTDGQFKLVEYWQRDFHFRATVPYHAVLLAVVVLLCGALAANLGKPLRRLAQTVDRFGAGELNVRTGSTRKDEIGDVSRAFDRMADRISTLLTSERRLLQDISHELRSPLARLAFAAELARTAPDREAAVARLKKEIARLTDLVGGLIQVTRAEGDPGTAHAEIVRFDELVTSLVEDCRFEAAQRPCNIAWDGVAAPQCTLRGDREVLRRAVENVLRNGIRYTAPGSTIEVSLFVPGSPRSSSIEIAGETACATNLDQQGGAGLQPATVRLAIRDFGPGVPADALEKIFTPFFRLDDSRDSSTGGIGLGLAIAQRAVTLHHGRLWAENAGPGLRVFIELPVAASSVAG